MALKVYMIALAAFGVLTDCHSRPTVEYSNGAVSSELTAINATINENDGADQASNAFIAVPTVGQRLDATPQPLKKQ